MEQFEIANNKQVSIERQQKLEMEEERARIKEADQRFFDSADSTMKEAKDVCFRKYSQ